jgi:beta-lactam-binding protein with PASTA domain
VVAKHHFMMANVVGQTQTAAQTAIIGVGLTVGTVTTAPSTTVPAGNIISQTPTAGTVVPLNTAVSFVISAGVITLDGLSSIVVEPTTPLILVDGTQAFTATGIFNDGTSQNLTATVTWTSGSPSVASIAATGVATGLANGTTTINATVSSITGNTTLTVRAKVPGDFTDPTATITTPAAGTEVTSPIDVIGTATDTNFLKYELAYAPAGETTTYDA